jgi:sialate O-acetylesterase
VNVEIAGEDKIFYQANAKIQSDGTVDVWSDKVPNPVAVRYAWKDYVKGELFNTAGLPASSFRTDDW